MFTPTDAAYEITFYGKNIRNNSDASWGLDNVRVFAAPMNDAAVRSVPAPGALACFAIALIASPRRRR